MPELDEDVLEALQTELRYQARAQTVEANAAVVRVKAQIYGMLGKQQLSQDQAEELLYELDNTLEVPSHPEA